MIDDHKKYILNLISALFLTLYFYQCIIFVIDKENCTILRQKPKMSEQVFIPGVHTRCSYFYQCIISTHKYDSIRIKSSFSEIKSERKTKMSKIIQAPEVKDEFLQCWLQCNNVNVNELPTRTGRNKVS